MLEVAAIGAILTPLISELLTPIAQQVGNKVGETLGDKSQKWLDFLIPDPKKKRTAEDTAIVDQAKQQYQQAMVKYAQAKDARDRELLSLTLAQDERRYQLQAQERQDKLQLGDLQRQLMRELQVKELEVKRQEITNNWDKDTWFSNLSRQETEQILQPQQHRLLILLSPPEISPDCPASFRNNLKSEMRSVGTFLGQHYPQQDRLRPVKFYSDYFTQPIADIDVERLQRILSPIPTVILYSDINDYAITFRVGFWGMQNREVSQFSTRPLYWERTKDALLAVGGDEKEALRLIRQLTVTIHKLLAAFLADLYYLNIDPNYEPQLFNLISEFSLDGFALDGFAKQWVTPYIETLRQIQQRQLAAYGRELQRLVVSGATTGSRATTGGLPLQINPDFAKMLRRGTFFDTALRFGNLDQQNDRFSIVSPLQLSNNPATENFSFDVKTVDSQGKITNTRRRQAEYLSEDAGNGIKLEMVSIPGGTFLMGSPTTEKERFDYESPQHSVSVKPFFIGKFPITQAQWQAVMNANPSGFQGANRPVENVSWNQAVEFCSKLSKKTGKTYRLPSEAEWEYACRAGTTTAFHFGETITTDLVNYDGNYPYASAPKGEDRQQTTEVGKFPPNAFGLYEMHGNVYEWCADHWHENYQNAPNDGTIWLSSDESLYRLLRGGSWSNIAHYCRAAYRGGCQPDNRFNSFGFRVVCS